MFSTAKAELNKRLTYSRNISELQFMEWLQQKDNGNSPQELLDVITHHLYHSTSEILVASTHLQ